MEKCIACGICAEKCPVKTTDEFNEGLSKRKAIYVPYPQAVPLKYVIDAEKCLYFREKTKGRCKACEKFCPSEAIKLDDREESVTLNVGSVIITAGSQPFDPSKFDNYQYSKFPNVITSIEFERILSAGGPSSGHVVRPSDNKEPAKIAWFQCIGSRDVNKCDNEYCSSVCCMYAIKEALIAKEHMGSNFEPTIFFMDVRTHGKDFEKYYNRAKAEGVKFIRSRVHTISEVDETGTLTLRYVSESGEIINEEFDMVVLSVGMVPSDSAIKMCKKLGLELNEFNFVKTDDMIPVATSTPGIYVAGALQGVKDIPESVMEASSAACRSSIDLTAARGALIRKKKFPDENDLTGETPRIGVFVCNCGINIGGFADVPAIAKYARSLPNVVYVEENLFTCSQDTQDKMVELIKEHNLNRIVVAACTPRTHESLFQETIRNAGINSYLFEMANIRNQCTWVHSDDKKNATEKSKDLVRMAVARASFLEPIPDISVDIKKSALIIGGGVAGMTAALSLADQGFPATIVETSSVLGGAARSLVRTWKGIDIQEYLAGLLNKVEKHPGIKLLTDSKVVGASGFVGNFETRVETGNETKTIEHGVTIVATGGKAADTDEYFYGKNPRVTRWHDLEKNPEKLKEAESIVFIQCVGSRDEKRPYCSRVCCAASISQAISIKESNPDTDVFILYRDIRTYGERELLFKKARKIGVVFVRYSLNNKPRVTEIENGLQIDVFDPVLQKSLEIKADLLNLATAIEPADNNKISEFYKIPLNTENFFMEAHAKLRPVDFANDGIFLCGLAHYPKALEESISQAMAAASRATTILAKDSVQISPLVSQVDVEKCDGCGVCAEVCPFGAIILEDTVGTGNRADYRSKNIMASCKGCGLCAASCPQKAIDMLHFRDRQIVASICSVV
jgi:heterodisulfide reductase subunit A2